LALSAKWLIAPKNLAKLPEPKHDRLYAVVQQRKKPTLGPCCMLLTGGTEVLRPMLFIGLGGAGGKTIRSIKQTLSEKLEQAGCSVDLSEVFHFLHIDMTLDGVDHDAPMLDPDEVMILAEPGKNYQHYLFDLGSQFPNEEESVNALGGWAKINPGILDGRSIARVIAFSRLQDIDSRISKTWDKLRSSRVEVLGKIALSLGFDSRLHDSSPQIMIFSSMGGNTGSAIYQDVLEVLVSKYSGSAYPISFLFANDVFDVSPAEESRMAANSMSFLAEISQPREVPSAGEFDFLSQNIKLSDPTNHFNPASLPKFLISGINDAGRRRSAAGSGSEHAAFAELGFEIGQILLQPELAELLFNNIVTAGPHRRFVERNALNGSEWNQRTAPCFLTFGYANLSVGFDSLARFVTDALVRAQIQVLLYPNFSPLPTEATSREISFEEVVFSRAETLWPTFLNKTGLDQLQTEEVLFRLLASQDQTLPEKFASAVLSASELSQGDFTGTEFASLTWAKWQNRQSKYQEITGQQLNEDLRDWADRSQNLIVDEIARVVSLEGLNVAQALVSKLMAEVDFVTRMELPREVAAKSHALNLVTADWWHGQVMNAMAGKTKIGARDSAAIESLQSKLVRWCEITTKVETLKALCDALVEFVSGALAALELSLKTAGFELMEQVTREGTLKTLPDWNEPAPSHYGAKFGQIQLIDPGHYQDVYQSVAARDLPTPEIETVWQRSVSSSLQGVPLHANVDIGLHGSSEYVQNLIRLDNAWVPSSLRESSLGDGVASFKIRHSVEDLKAENWRWIWALDSAFGTQGLASIRSYVEDMNHEVRGHRERVFLDKLRQMFAQCEPHSRLNHHVMRDITDGGEAATGTVTRISRQLPFGPTDHIHEQLVDLLRSCGFYLDGPSFTREFLDPTSTSSAVSALSARYYALPFYAFSSVTDPVVKIKGWSARFAPSLGRSRPLLETIPVERGVRSSIFTGWLVANAFGLINTETEVLGQQRAQIWNPTLEHSAGFSDFIGVNVDKTRGARAVPVVLPAILSGITLALSEYGSSGDTTALEAFEFLLYVGREVTSATGVDYWSGGDGQLLPNGEWHRSTYLSDWIKGISDNPFNTPVDVSSPMANAPGTRIARKAHLATYLKDVHSELSLLMDDLDALPWSEKPAIWEIGRPLLENLVALQKFVDDFPDEDRPSLLDG